MTGRVIWRGGAPYHSVLELLEKERVLRIKREDDGSFTATEMCDEYFYETLTQDELLRLSEEIAALARGE